MSQASENSTAANITFDPQLLLENKNDEEFRNQLPATVYTALLMIIGTPGNIVVLYVYFFKWRKSTSRMFILFLTALDLVNCVTTLPVEIYIMRYSLMLDRPWLCKISRFCTYTFNSSSAAILVGIAVDRFKRICRPHGPQFSAQQSMCICIFCIGVALSITWPSVIFYGTRVIDYKLFLGKACLLQNDFDSSMLPYVYFIVMMGSTVVIFTTLSVLYYFVGVQVYKHRRLRMRRKANRGAAQNLVDRCCHQKEETLLQDSDSAELRKTVKQNGNDKQDEGIEMKTLTTDMAVNGKIENALDKDNENDETTYLNKARINGKSKNTFAKAIDNDETTNLDKAVTNGKVENLISKADENDETEDLVQASPGEKDKGEIKKKNFIARKSQAFKNSISRRNGPNCINVKLRIGRSTLMLFLITIAYIISFLPFYTIAIIRQTYSDFVKQLSVPGYMLYHVFLRSYLLSSAINPIIYSFCNAQFRTFCLDLFRKKEVRRGVL